MSIFNIFKNQLSDVIEWKAQSPETLWYKHPSKNNEIINASKLVVAPGQGCILVYEGKVENILLEEGMYNLKTDNHPFFTTLSKFRQNFESEHKLYIYFFRTADVLNQFWGTSNPIKYIDAIYKIPVELGANGVFGYRINNPATFYSQIVGNKEIFTTEELREIIINKFPQEISSLLAGSKYSYAEIDANLSKISEDLKNVLNKDFESVGVALIDFKINGTRFDEKTQQRIGSIADITSETMAAKEGSLSFEELERLRALRDAARNTGGLAGIGAQLGAGMEISKLFDLKKDEVVQQGSDDFSDKLKKLNLLLKEEIISQQEYDDLKKQILSKL